ncbi:splicing factor 3b [Anaeramoeba flamelloides]|uniref:Splicing factor 3b n=1 Tax=Anaeramoeba flamelloides TaxID=1746091 RepID=A0ABQ8YRD9_9EUKA|nr:splicing factor 3b [Anaeramoeba flamelloides]
MSKLINISIEKTTNEDLSKKRNFQETNQMENKDTNIEQKKKRRTRSRWDSQSKISKPAETKIIQPIITGRTHVPFTQPLVVKLPNSQSSLLGKLDSSGLSILQGNSILSTPLQLVKTNNNNNNNGNNGQTVKTSLIRKSRWEDKPTTKTSSWTEKEGEIGKAGEAIKEQKSGFQMNWGETPKVLNAGMETPLVVSGAMTPVLGAPSSTLSKQIRYERDLMIRNKYLSDEELDKLLPKDGYKVLEPPKTYVPIRTPSRKLTATPSPMIFGTPLYNMPDENSNYSMQGGDNPFNIPQTPSHLPSFKPEDIHFFQALLEDKEEDELDEEEFRDRMIMELILKVKNGTPPIRRKALRTLTNRARSFGAGPLFDLILPLLSSPSLDEQERHLLVKLVDRVLYKLNDLVKPYTKKILDVIEPLIVDKDYYARIEGREILSNLAKAVGLSTMINSMLPSFKDENESVRDTTAKAFAVIANALGIPSLLKFLKALSISKKSWKMRHTGIKIVQQIAVLMGSNVLPHLTSLIEIITAGLNDSEQRIKIITAHAIASLAEASAPYGIESFDEVLKPLWLGIREQRSKGLAAFLKAIGFILPLMEPEHASVYSKQLVPILIREFTTSDDDMKRVVLMVVRKCVNTEGVDPEYLKKELIPPFFKNFWIRRSAIKKNSRHLVDTTVELGAKVGSSIILDKIVIHLKDMSEIFRRMVMQCIQKLLSKTGTSEIDQRLQELLIDGCLVAFQEPITDDGRIIIGGFKTILETLGKRSKPYLHQIGTIISWRLENMVPKIRQQAVELIRVTAPIMQLCEEKKLLNHFGQVLYEFLGEEYPEVLGSLIGALKSIVEAVGIEKMNPPIVDILTRLTPILKNRHEKVQQNCIELIGLIAEEGASHVSSREWMRICFELIEALKAKKKLIRKVTVKTFGSIAKAIGPQDVLLALLNNLKVQDRTHRLFTTVAISIISQACGPFTTLPAILNEFKVPDQNVKSGVLKSLGFIFEYIGESSKDYIYSVVTLLEDALSDHHLVHRQLACNVVKSLATACTGLGCEDALTHLFNFLWPNVFELKTPHLINSVYEAIEALRIALGPYRILQHVLQGIFHPARKVRSVMWKIYGMNYFYEQDALIPFYPRIDDDIWVNGKLVEGIESQALVEHQKGKIEEITENSHVIKNTYVRTQLEYLI